MASGRFVSASIAEDERLAQLSLYSELLYLKTIPHLDRDGMILGKPGYLWGKICPLREELIGEMQSAIKEWVRVGLVIETTSDVGPVLFFPGFLKNNNLPHYNRERPSRFEPPAGYMRTEKGLIPVIETDEVLESVLDEINDEVAESVLDSDLQDQEEVKDQVQPKDDEDDRRTRDPIHAAWFETFAAEMPTEIERAIGADLDGCSDDAIVHAIRASVNAKERTFRYLKTCALNYIPPAPEQPPANSNPYTVDIPGVHRMEPPAQPTPTPPPLPAPLAHDDPWAVCLNEFRRELASGFVPILEGSQLEAAGTVADADGREKPLYRVLIAPEKAARGLSHFTHQVGGQIRRKLGTVLGKPVLIEIVAHETETAAPPPMHMQTEVVK